MMPESSLSLHKPLIPFDDKLELRDHDRVFGRANRFGVVRDLAGFEIGHLEGPGFLKP